MKKTLLIMSLLVTAALARAQSYDSIPHHYLHEYDAEVRNLMQMRDGSILANCPMFDNVGTITTGSDCNDIGNRLLKISRHGATLLDSVFLDDPDMNYFLMEPNPSGKGYVFAKVVRDRLTCRSDLSIRFFDENLQFLDGQEIWVPLCDTLTNSLCDFYLLEGRNIIVAYAIESRKELHFARIGLDGTLKETTTMHDFRQTINQLHGKAEMFVYNENPTEYCFWGWHYTDKMRIKGIVLDSLLNPKEVFVPLGMNSYQQHFFHHDPSDDMINLDDSTLLVSVEHSLGTKTGVFVAKIRKSDMAILAFKTFPSSIDSNAGSAAVIGSARASDGNIFYAYFTFRGADALCAAGQVSVVKMDQDLNVIWQRYFLEPVGVNRFGGYIKALGDGGVVVGGIVIGATEDTPSSLFFLVVNDDYDALEEQGVIVRPYAFWPNPAHDELRLQYSPDVKPAQAELFDLQGRLVLRQRNGLETLNLQGLAAGTYTLRVTLEDGKTFSDKVVKE